MIEHTSYLGPERRTEQRRKHAERRELIRFESNKDPRRKGHGRRKGEMNDPWERNEI